MCSVPWSCLHSLFAIPIYPSTIYTSFTCNYREGPIYTICTLKRHSAKMVYELLVRCLKQKLGLNQYHPQISCIQLIHDICILLMYVIYINHGSYVICHDDDITLYKAQVVYSAYPSKPNFTRGHLTLSLSCYCSCS